MKIHNSHIFARCGYKKLIPEDILHILTLNKEDEVTCSNDIKYNIFGEIWTSKLHWQSFRQKKNLKLTNSCT